MGRSYQGIVFVDVTAADAAAAREDLLEWLFRREVLRPEPDEDGLHPAGGEAPTATSGRWDLSPAEMGAVGRVIAGRTVYWSEHGLGVWCPQCRWEFEPDDGTDATAEWERGGPGGEVSCPECGLRKPLGHWDSDWAAGELGLELWDFPDLSAWFLRDVGRWVGSRVRLARGARYDGFD